MSICSIIGFSGCMYPYPPKVENRRFERARASYELQRFDNLLVSNSPIVTKNLIQKTEDGVKVNASWLIRNISQASVSLQIDKINLALNEDSQNMNCLVNGQKFNSFEVEAQQKVVLSCSANILPNAKNQLSKRDTMGIFKIPYGNKEKTITDQILLKIEDFEK